MFDSHARYFMGDVDGNGAAILLSFNDVSDILQFFRLRYHGLQFDLTPVDITAVTVDDQDEVTAVLY